MDLQKFEAKDMKGIVTKWLDLQEVVNCLYDSSKASKFADKEITGIKQLLEKKEGLFRMKMMGKRVNYSGRSVISPDPNLETNEIGIPLFMAKKLTFPEFVNESNFEYLRELVINGATQYPGANFIEENGNKIALESRTLDQRKALAKTLLTSNSGTKRVFRHMRTGDFVLFNRQPSLHRPSIMAHKVRVLPKEQTIRMHYCNCNSYNADFDGDEMNVHFLQTYLARSEAERICLTDLQYIVPKDGKPIRGLIQDSIVSAVFLTSKFTFLEKDLFQMLVFTGVGGLIGNKKISIVPPAIIRPKCLWTGKQVIHQIVESLTEGMNIKLTMTSKSKLTSEALGPVFKDDAQIRVVDNELLTGILDKNQIGSSAFGFFHCFYEIFGEKLTGKLITAFSRVFTFYMQIHGFSCGMDDLLLAEKAERKRFDLIKKAHEEVVKEVIDFLGESEKMSVKSTWNLTGREKTESQLLKKKPDVDYIAMDNPLNLSLERKFLYEKGFVDKLDNEVKGAVNSTSTEILKISNTGLQKSFPENFFSAMVMTGAKGSLVNHNQVSVILGQQELEGKRVPLLPNGKTLPSFVAFDPNPRAGGFITDRFLSGLRPQEFFFHCMAGREGLIDTAVKTSRSGYLQRCLIKHMESLIVEYDYTVRDCDGSIIQFYYGEDSIDSMKSGFTDKFEFLAENYKSYLSKFNPGQLLDILPGKEVKRFLRKSKENPSISAKTTIMNEFRPGSYLGAISESSYEKIQKFVEDEKQKEGNSIFERLNLAKKSFFTIFLVKNFFSLITPGDAVGPIAAQSLGEPSTQLTLNTFHLAGHGGANVTLGIPRLTEILMTGSQAIKTPMMILRFQDTKMSKQEAENYARRLQKISLMDLVQSIKIEEQNIFKSETEILPSKDRVKAFTLEISLESLKAIEYCFGISEQKLREKFLGDFAHMIFSQIQKKLKRKLVDSGIKANLRENSSSESHIEEEIEETVSKPEISIEEDEDEDFFIDEDAHEKKKAREKAKKKSQKKALAGQSHLFNDTTFENGLFKTVFHVPLDSPKFLMLNFVEQTLQNVLVNEVPKINRIHLIKEGESFALQTEGVNFKAVWNMDFMNPNRIESNDIHQIFKHFGVFCFYED